MGKDRVKAFLKAEPADLISCDELSRLPDPAGYSQSLDRRINLLEESVTEFTESLQTGNFDGVADFRDELRGKLASSTIMLMDLLELKKCLCTQLRTGRS